MQILHAYLPLKSQALSHASSAPTVRLGSYICTTVTVFGYVVMVGGRFFFISECGLLCPGIDTKISYTQLFVGFDTISYTNVL